MDKEWNGTLVSQEATGGVTENADFMALGS